MIIRKTIPETVTEVAAQYPNNVSLCRKENGVWTPITYSELVRRVNTISKGLFFLGLRPKDRIALMLGNSPEWALTDLGALFIGACDVPLYGTLAPDQVIHIVKDSGAKMILVNGEDQVLKLKKVINDLTSVELVISIDENVGAFGSKKSVTFKELQKLGSDASSAVAKEVADAGDKVDADDLASIIYTSGTTGMPKGVMLTHKNIMSNIEGIDKAVDIVPTDSHLSFLPLSHVFERTCGYYTLLATGARINYAENMDKIAENIREIHPTVVISVPRLFEKMVGKIKEKVANSPKIRQTLFYWALDVGNRATDKHNPGRNSIGLKIQYILAKALVFKKLHQAFGGRIKYFISGGAALSPDLSNFFRSIGIAVVEGYGLTETSPVIAVNPPDDIRAGTVGKILANLEVKFEKDGELLVRGPSITKGYYNNDEATREAFEKDGWFHTGDIAELDVDGYLRITDRKKDLIVMSNGKNVAPLTIESKLVTDDFIAQAVVIGNNRNYISALIVPDFARLERAAVELGLADKIKDRKSLVTNPHVVALYQEKIDKLMENFARFEQIKKFTLLPEEFTEANGILTPKLSIKRKVVNKVYADVIEKMYPVGNSA